MISKLEYILELTQDLVMEFDQYGTYLNIWTKDESLLARPKNELLGKKIGDILTEDETSYYLQLISKVINDEVVQELKYKIVTLKGERDFGARIVPIVRKDQTTAVLFANDITEKVKMQNEYERQKDILSDVVENSPGVVYQCLIKKDNSISFPYLAKKIYEVYGYTREEVYADNFIMHIVKHPDERDIFKQKLKESVKNLTQLDWIGKITTKLGQLKWIHIQGSPRRTEYGDTVITGIFFDITKQKQKEDEMNLKQAQLNHQLKLASLGELAAGVGHEINNPLNIVINTLLVIKDKFLKNEITHDEMIKLLDISQISSNRIGKIVKGLKSLSRMDSVDETEKFDLREVLNITYLLVKELCRKDHIELSLDIKGENELWTIGNKGEIEQVLMNIISNAIDAVKDVEMGMINISSELKENKILIEVSDNGCGIPSEILSKILDPFFTTKEAGRGTGLGLSLVNSIIHKHKGQIEFKSSNKGTTVFITLPCS